MGDIKKVFILHGWTYSLDKWQTFLNLLKEKGIEPIMLNVPGLTSQNDKVWGIDDYVLWLKKIIDKEKGEIVIVGHSNGGRIALSFVLKYPEKVKKLILIDSAGIYHNELSVRIKRLIFRSIAKIGKKFTSSKILENLLYKLVRESEYKEAPENMKKTMVNLISVDLKPQLAKINIPTLIIWGAKDKITTLSDGELMHKLIKNSKLTTIEDAKHSPQFTNARQVTDIIYEYI